MALYKLLKNNFPIIVTLILFATISRIVAIFISGNVAKSAGIFTPDLRDFFLIVTAAALFWTSLSLAQNLITSRIKSLIIFKTKNISAPFILNDFIKITKKELFFRFCDLRKNTKTLEDRLHLIVLSLYRLVFVFIVSLYLIYTNTAIGFSLLFLCFLGYVILRFGLSDLKQLKHNSREHQRELINFTSFASNEEGQKISTDPKSNSKNVQFQENLRKTLETKKSYLFLLSKQKLLSEFILYVPACGLLFFLLFKTNITSSEIAKTALLTIFTLRTVLLLQEDSVELSDLNQSVKSLYNRFNDSPRKTRSKSRDHSINQAFLFPLVFNKCSITPKTKITQNNSYSDHYVFPELVIHQSSVNSILLNDHISDDSIMSVLLGYGNQQRAESFENSIHKNNQFDHIFLNQHLQVISLSEPYHSDVYLDLQTELQLNHDILKILNISGDELKKKLTTSPIKLNETEIIATQLLEGCAYEKKIFIFDASLLSSQISLIELVIGEITPFLLKNGISLIFLTKQHNQLEFLKKNHSVQETSISE